MTDISIKLTIMAILWAGGFIVCKVLSPMAGPFTITFVRFGIVALMLGVLVHGKGQRPLVLLKHWGFAAIAGLLGVLGYSYFFLKGIVLLDAGRGSVIISTVPIAVAIFSHIFSDEKITPAKAGAFLISLVGAWVVISHGQWETVAGLRIGKGEIYMILCVICASVYALSSKRILDDLTPLVTMTLVSAMGAGFCLVPAVLEMQARHGAWHSPGFILGMLYLSLGPSVVAVIFYFEAINRIGAARASQYMNLIPVFTVILGMVFLKEKLTAALLLGGVLVIWGLYLAQGSGPEGLPQPQERTNS